MMNDYGLPGLGGAVPHARTDDEMKRGLEWPLQDLEAQAEGVMCWEE
jgi:hypothetical protein